ncbi:Gfo/Idh/MocA family oxidoreductase [Sulfurospirillum diekertiae]|uniref:Gfo/Idh/MocA family oxidoreductase n=1 Tax=Sulfurospirillum diekertiae TaxID=1854492 RepID=UPI0021127296|nr:Gfo/Idh/MocA family oxidoreductase [Sulfurospirillum diekertiae]
MVKVALIGLGSMGQNHYRVLKSLPEFELTALCDIQQTREYDEPFYTDIDEMLEKADFQAVVYRCSNLFTQKCCAQMFS